MKVNLWLPIYTKYLIGYSATWRIKKVMFAIFQKFQAMRQKVINVAGIDMRRTQHSLDFCWKA